MKARFLIAWIVVIIMVGLMSHLVGPNTDAWLASDDRPAATAVSGAPAPSAYRLPSE